MSVPPSRSSSGSSHHSKKSDGPTSDRKTNKDFNLPRKGRKDEEQSDKKGLKEDELKKKSLFDIAGEKGEVPKGLEQDIEAKVMGKAGEAASIQTSQASASVAAIGKLIQSVVTELRIGQVGGKDFTTMNLTTKAGEIPEAFAGSNLTLSYQANSLIIHFDNFMTPQQQNNAITLVEKNKEQLLDMMQALQAKNINIQEMSIGKHVVNLPRVEPLPPPFQPSRGAETETRQQREHQERGGEEGAGPE